MLVWVDEAFPGFLIADKLDPLIALGAVRWQPVPIVCSFQRLSSPMIQQMGRSTHYKKDMARESKSLQLSLASHSQQLRAP
jgi:hypothetical protein